MAGTEKVYMIITFSKGCARVQTLQAQEERTRVQRKELHRSRFQFDIRKSGDFVVKKAGFSHSTCPKLRLVAKPVSLLYFLGCSFTKLLKLGNMATIQLSLLKPHFNHPDLLILPPKFSSNLFTTIGTATTLS